MDYWLLGELAITGVLVGAMYGLVALGIVLIYKTSGTANFAQGGIAMMGAYLAWAFSSAIGLPVWIGIPIAVVVMFGFGILVERTILRRMIGQPVIMVIMLTFGLELFVARRGARLSRFGGEAAEPGDSAGPGVSRRDADQPRLSGRRRRFRAADRRGDRSVQLTSRHHDAGGVRRSNRIVVGRYPGRARDRHRLGTFGRRGDVRGHSMGQHAGGRLEPVALADESARDRHSRRPRQHSRRFGCGRDRRRLRKPRHRRARPHDRRRHPRHRRLRHHASSPC